MVGPRGISNFCTVVPTPSLCPHHTVPKPSQQEAPEELEAGGAQQPEVEEADDQPEVTYKLVEF
jgi:hypothetical protein